MNSSPQSTVHGLQLLEDKTRQVKETLARFPRVIVAFSGGVDSTLLLSLAQETIGAADVLAVTADSPSLSRRDLDDARRLARELRARHLVIETNELENPAYQANTQDRCYLCKRTLFVELEELAQRLQIPVMLYGAIGDDAPADRPGERAAAERGVRAPLQEAGLEKWEVRELAHQRGLSNWDKPQDACLSSRIPHGLAVTETKLRQIEIAEDALVSLGFPQVRVRHLGTHARIEVGQEDVGRFEDAGLCRAVAQRLERLGFASVSISRYVPGGANRFHAEERLLVTSDPGPPSARAGAGKQPRHRPTASGRGPVGIASAKGWAGTLSVPALRSVWILLASAGCRPTRGVGMGATGSARGAPQVTGGSAA